MWAVGKASQKGVDYTIITVTVNIVLLINYSYGHYCRRGVLMDWLHTEEVRDRDFAQD